MQGLGNAVFEEILFENGRLVNGSLLQYRVPNTLDLPSEMGSLLIETEMGLGPTGRKVVVGVAWRRSSRSSLRRWQMLACR